jgi:aspartate/methionine/tyrosine aminotransferase
MGKVPFSGIREVFEQVNSLEESGASITHMEIGRPDFDTPAHIKTAAIKALENGQVHYSSNRGIPELGHAIAEKLERENGIRVDPETEVLITVGCTEAVLVAFLAFLGGGEEVLIPEPSWQMYAGCAGPVGARPVPLREENGFELDPGDVAARITPRTKMLVLCSPHNPTGAVLETKTVQALAGLCLEHELLVLSDEIYDKMLYDGAKHTSIASLSSMSERTVTINGFSKAYAMDGWRLGYAAGHRGLVRHMLKAHQHATTCANTFAQFGAAAAYRGPQECVAEMVGEFDRRRRFLIEALNSLPGVTCATPRGAFYAFLAFRGYEMDSRAMAAYLLQEARVACVPGTAFGVGGEGFVRFAYSTDYQSIVAGTERVRVALGELRG